MKDLVPPIAYDTTCCFSSLLGAERQSNPDRILARASRLLPPGLRSGGRNDSIQVASLAPIATGAERIGEMPRIDGERVIADLKRLAEFGRYKTGVHRPTYSPVDVES